jgi:hypothetical protein
VTAGTTARSLSGERRDDPKLVGRTFAGPASVGLVVVGFDWQEAVGSLLLGHPNNAGQHLCPTVVAVSGVAGERHVLVDRFKSTLEDCEPDVDARARRFDRFSIVRSEDSLSGLERYHSLGERHELEESRPKQEHTGELSGSSFEQGGDEGGEAEARLNVRSVGLGGVVQERSPPRARYDPIILT